METVRVFCGRWGVLFALWGCAISAGLANPAYDPPAGYYAPAAGLSGAGLKAALHEIIDDHVRYPYSSSYTDTWNILRDSDQDPNNPANVILVYNGASVNGALEYNNGAGWNREHVWPQSLGGFGTNPGPGTDCHNLKPCSIAINSGRDNLEFDDGGAAYTAEGLTLTYRDGNSFEPNPAFKGDLARIIFYMAVRYEGDAGEPDLEMDDLTNGDTYTFGKRSTLLLWHALDPVDEFERRRNSRIAAYQGNRNPFIDHPEYAQAIWGAERPVPVITQTPVASPVVAGQSLAESSLTGGVANVPGTFAWQNPAVVPTASGPQNAVFSPDQPDQYQSVTLAVTVTVQTPLESWASGYGLSGAEAAAGADPDGDGWSNAQEYAFGLAPNVAGGELVQMPAGGGKITYLQRSGVTYVVRSATDLGTAFNGTVSPVKSSPQPGGLPAGYEQWEAAMPGGSRGFLKVEATIAP